MMKTFEVRNKMREVCQNSQITKITNVDFTTKKMFDFPTLTIF